MSKYQSFRVELEFSGNIVSDEEIMEIAQNIANGLVSQANHEGLTPVDSDEHTCIIRVTPQYLDKTIIEHP